MTRNRFDVVLTILHFNGNKLASPCTSQDHNKLHKIELVIEFFNARFNEVAFPETNEAVDEMMIPFKGKHSVKMYMTKKPVKWGYKLWCRAGISGYVYEFEILGGRGTKGTSENIQSQYVFGESEICYASCQQSPTKGTQSLIKSLDLRDLIIIKDTLSK